jgi:uncharacterized membrane protein
MMSLAYRQRGAIGLMAAVTLGLALLFMLLVLDSGRLYLEQRKLQRVADMAALEAANQQGVCNGNLPSAVALATAAATRNGFSASAERSLSVSCGTLSTNVANLRTFSADASASQAVQVIARHTVPTSVAAGVATLFSGGPRNLDTQLQAVAVAASPGPPRAQLNIRNALVTVDSTNGPLLNAVFGGLLGGAVNLSVAQWNGLLNTDINLLSYLKQLAVVANVDAGNFTQVLGTSVTLTQLVQAAAQALPQSTSTLDAAAGIAALQLAAQVAPLKNLQLGNLLDIDTASPTAGLDANVQLLTLLQAMVQLANSKNAASVELPIKVGALANATVRIRVVEPPQFSAVGNPEKAKLDPKGADQIYVHTAQIRVLASVQLGLLDTVLDLANGLFQTANLLNLGCLLGECTKLIPAKPLGGTRLDLGISLAEASAYVTDYDCSGNKKDLVVEESTAAASILVGNVNSSDFFANGKEATVSPIVLLNINSQHCRGLLGLTCDLPINQGGGGLGIRIDGRAGVGNAISGTHVFNNTPDVGQPSKVDPFPLNGNAGIIGSLKHVFSGIELVSLKATDANLLSSVLNLVTGVLGLVLNGILPSVTTLLGSLLDPIVETLLKLLGIDLATVNVGANLTCHSGQAQLVI